MKVILTANIKKLGMIGELVTVKNGFARNGVSRKDPFHLLGLDMRRCDKFRPSD